jgi:hypothetical protein
MEIFTTLYYLVKDWIPSGSKTISRIYDWFDSLGPWLKKVLTFMLMLTAKAVVGNTIVATTFSLLSTIVLPAIGVVADFSALAFVNYLFPFDTLCQFLVGYGALRLACAVFRMTKSFVPTVS